jgi:hypothetical protein
MSASPPGVTGSRGSDVGLDPVIHRPAGVEGVDDEPLYRGGVAELGTL